VTVWEDDYKVGNHHAAVALLKVIIRVSDIDTNATASYIRTQLANLDEYMATIDSDIEKFNQHVRELILQLQQRRQASTDVLTNLFKGYKAAKDKQFVAYIKRKEEQYEEGSALTQDDLMTHAANKYKIIKQKGEWQSPSEEQAKILALETKVKSLEGKKKTKPGKPGTPKKTKGKGKGKQSEKREQKIPEWQKKEPGSKDPKTKTVDGKQYHWCVHHARWTRHKSEECKLQDKSKSQNKDNSDKKRIKFNKAMNAAAYDESSDVISDEE